MWLGLLILAGAVALALLADPPTRSRPLRYWLLVAFLLGFGVLTGFSVGPPFLLFGLALVLLAPFRSRPGIFWPAVAAVASFIVGFMLVAPLVCTSTATEAVVTESEGQSSSQPATTTCNSLIGITYRGPGTYHPSLLPALVVGSLAALGSALLNRLGWLDQAG
ncbi:MAG: hypothetical protein M3N51_10585 [Actinomycetota bacterium]|nr:hypothetical protein [Actinomycetota bacterium]